MSRQKLTRLLASILVLVPTLLSGAIVDVVRQNDGFVIHSNVTPFSHFKVKVLGEVSFTFDNKDVESMSPGGYLSIERRVFLRTTKVVFEADDRGRIARTFFRGSFSDEIDQYASNWITEAILETFYLTGIGVDSRIKRMLSDGEPLWKVLALAERMSGSEGQYNFYKAFGRQDISTEDRVAMASSAGVTVKSSYWLGLILREWSAELAPADDFALALVEASDRMSSSYEKSRTLISLAENIKMNEATGGAIADIISGISSSYEQSRAIIGVAPHLTEYPAAMDDLVQATTSISSSYEQKRSLAALSALSGSKAAHHASIASAAANISSSYELGQTLIGLTALATASNEFVENYLQSVSKISSSYEQSRTLIALARMSDLTAEHVIGLINMASTISSSYEIRRVLREVGSRPVLSDSEIIAYIDAAAQISSSHEQSRVMTDLIKGRELSDEMVRYAFDMAREIDNSTSRRQVMDLLLDRL
ncbi:MAG: hypothetical protein IIA59_04860 [Candidatus Marinimicrobia bacterium]|nr:hypothetical protein [Candidatus Neomarinimicrobiota bacterium]